MRPLDDPISADALARELTSETYITRFKDLEVHMFTSSEAPSVLEEVGRIREFEYRRAGAGRNVARDVDSFDTGNVPYSQLVSFDRNEGELVAMYRAVHCGAALERGGTQALRTSGLFTFSNDFLRGELPHLVELGRSVVNREARRAVQGLFSVWAGLGALICEWSDIAGFFGNVSVYSDVTDEQLETLLSYLYRFHGDRECRVTAKPECAYRTPRGLPRAPGSLQELTERASSEGWTIPPILISYLKASPGLIAFDTAVDRDFGLAREIAVMVPVDSITPKTRKRIVDPYISVNPGRFTR